jgi:DNA polymerase I
MKNKEKIFLLDAMALIYKYYYVFLSRPLVTKKGQNVGTIYGFMNFLFGILEKENPGYLVVAFDNKAPTFRHKLYPEYKATRQKMPEDLIPQMEKIKEIVKQMNISLIEIPGFEADDIVGTIAKTPEAEGLDVYCVTSDKDYMQLITDNIKIYRLGKFGNEVEIITENEVKTKFGVPVNQLLDFFALMGDTSDNVPGVPGVGEKTALSLMLEYHSLDNIYKNIDKIDKKALAEKLKNNKELAYLSKELVTIDLAVPIDSKFDDYKIKDYDKKELLTVFRELEFKSLEKRLLLSEEFKESEEEIVTDISEEAPEAIELPEENIKTGEHKYHTITGFNKLDSLIKTINEFKYFSYDLETTSTDALNADMVGIAISLNEREAFYIPVSADLNISSAKGDTMLALNFDSVPKNDNSLKLSDVLEKLKPILESSEIKKCGQNIKYDMLVTSRYGIKMKGIDFDTMIASYIIDPDGQINLDALAKRYLNYKMVPISDLIGSGKNQKNMRDIPIEIVSDYACEDADAALRLKKILVDELEKDAMSHLCYDIEFPLVSVLFEMESNGVLIDTKLLKKISRELEKSLITLESEIHELAGEKFNINSTKQLQDILFNKLKLVSGKKTKTGQSTDVSVLEDLKSQHPVAEKLLEYRQNTKLKSTYIDALPDIINPATGRIHTSFNQTIVTTGRLSSSNPNLQNIPIRKEIGKEIRKAFIPSPGFKILSADYSQIELRVMAEITQDENLINAFLNNEDIHTSTASKVFGVTPKEVTSDMRRKAKEINFGIMYGIGPFGLKSRLEITQTEAKNIIDNYFIKYPGIKKYMDNTIAEAREKGYVQTLLGRRRYFKNINSKNATLRQLEERAAINMPIQGTAAEMIKVAMIKIQEHIDKNRLKSKMIMQVHDELVFEIAENEVSAMTAIIDQKMRSALEMKVPIKVDIGIGNNWYESHN